MSPSVSNGGWWGPGQRRDLSQLITVLCYKYMKTERPVASMRLGVTVLSCNMKPGNGPFRAGAATLVLSVSVLLSSSEHSGPCSQAYRMASPFKQEQRGED